MSLDFQTLFVIGLYDDKRRLTIWSICDQQSALDPVEMRCEIRDGMAFFRVRVKS